MEASSELLAVRLVHVCLYPWGWAVLILFACCVRSDAGWRMGRGRVHVHFLSLVKICRLLTDFGWLPGLLPALLLHFSKDGLRPAVRANHGIVILA